MSRIVHLCVNIRGLLLRPDRDLRGWIKDDSGRVVGPGEARMLLMDELAKGRKVLPTGPCEGFSYDAGCPGHDDAEVQDASL
jgi:hypothetical protein